MYLGTDHGVLVSKDEGKTWRLAFGELSRKKIFNIAIDEENRECYFATDGGLFRYHLAQDSLRRVFTEASSNEEDKTDIEIGQRSDDDSNEARGPEPRISILITKENAFPLLLGTAHGVFLSDDEGETWQRLSNTGLHSTTISDLAYSKKAHALFVATPRGVFSYDSKNKRWEEINKGLPQEEIFDLAIQVGITDKLIAATKSGIFYHEIESPVYQPEVRIPIDSKIMDKASELIRWEPSIQEVREKAIKYANVGNGKIKRWHMGSRLRGLVPNLTFSKDLDISNNIHVDTGSTTTPDIFAQGPDERGRSTDVHLTWELGDLIWSSAQTSIDSREKLMVELRGEILGEVTRLYFERRRLQIEFLANPPSEPLEHMNTLLKIEELTANLDALTDGYFSKRLTKLYQENPALSELWKFVTSGDIITSD